MEPITSTILIPYDFTEIADKAVAHAVVLCGKMNTSIVLLHVVKKENLIDDLQQQLQMVADKVQTKHGIKAVALVRDGTIFKTINQVVEELDSILVVMGTHGMRGMQKLTGSHALKVIVGSKIPYLVVQDEPDYTKEITVLFPIDYKVEAKEKLKWVGFLSKIFSIKVVLFATTTKDGAIDVATKANVVFCKKYLDERAINYTIELSEQSASFHEQIVQTAKNVGASLILIITTRDIGFHDYVLGVSEQYIIANDEKIDVFVVNPRTDLMKYGYGNFG